MSATDVRLKSVMSELLGIENNGGYEIYALCEMIGCICNDCNTHILCGVVVVGAVGDGKSLVLGTCQCPRRLWRATKDDATGHCHAFMSTETSKDVAVANFDAVMFIDHALSIARFVCSALNSMRRDAEQ